MKRKKISKSDIIENIITAALLIITVTTLAIAIYTLWLMWTFRW